MRKVPVGEPNNGLTAARATFVSLNPSARSSLRTLHRNLDNIATANVSELRQMMWFETPR